MERQEGLRMNWRALAAEAVGTFVLVGVGSLGVASAALIGGQNSGPLLILLIVPFCFGFALMAAIAIAGDVSGGHFNPAVTLAAVLDGRTTWSTGIAYAVAQAIGAFAASGFILLALSADFVRITVNQPGPVGGDSALAQDLHAFAVELMLTAVFVAVILTVSSRAPEKSVFVIPLTLLMIHFAAIPLSGASVNPVRSLAPAVWSGTYGGLWVYLTAPFIGAILGWGVFRLLRPTADEGEFEDDEDFDDEELDEDEGLEPA
jgi:MIP family channel proteins